MNMKIVALLLVAGSMAWADGNSAQNTAPASATLIRPIAVSKVSDLVFGSLLIPAGYQGGSLTVLSNGSINNNLGSSASTYTHSATPSPAQFTVTGEPGYPWVFASGVLNLSLGSTGTAVQVIPKASVGNLAWGGATASTTVAVGGQLRLPANVKPGSYSGSFNVYVNYL